MVEIQKNIPDYKGCQWNDSALSQLCTICAHRAKEVYLELQTKPSATKSMAVQILLRYDWREFHDIVGDKEMKMPLILMYKPVLISIKKGYYVKRKRNSK